MHASLPFKSGRVTDLAADGCSKSIISIHEVIIMHACLFS